MAKEQSIAPKERVNIVYKSATNAAEDVELPLKMLMMGDYTLQQDSRALVVHPLNKQVIWRPKSIGSQASVSSSRTRGPSLIQPRKGFEAIRLDSRVRENDTGSTEYLRDAPLEDRKPVSVDKENFNEVLAAHNINLNIQVPNRLQEGDQAGDLNVKLEIKNIRDFEPDQVIEQIPELKKLLEIRQALVALKGPLGNVPSFRKKLQGLVQNQETLTQLCQELGINEEGGAV